MFQINFSCFNFRFNCLSRFNCCKNSNSGDRTNNVQVESALRSVTTCQPTPYPSRHSFSTNIHESTDTKVGVLIYLKKKYSYWSLKIGVQVNEANPDNNQMNPSTRSTTISTQEIHGESNPVGSENFDRIRRRFRRIPIDRNPMQYHENPVGSGRVFMVFRRNPGRIPIDGNPTKTSSDQIGFI